MINAYAQSFNMGHKAIERIFDGHVIVEEKIDGSQFSFALIDGELHCRSKRQPLYIDNPEKMFARGLEFVASIKDKLTPNWVYRCEYMQRPKHNVLAYDRIPTNHLMLFDIDAGLQNYLPHIMKTNEAKRIGIEPVPLIYEGIAPDFDVMKSWLDKVSVLGGAKIEGFVIKNYNVFTSEKKIALGKFVSEHFKEVHAKTWKSDRPTRKDTIAILTDKYRTQPRWEKAIQHLRDDGSLTETPKDIGALIKEVQTDIYKECEEEIKEFLFAHFWPQLKRSLVRGLPEWYKEQLAKNLFKGDA